MMESLPAILLSTALSIGVGKLAADLKKRKSGSRRGRLRRHDPLEDVLFCWPETKDAFTLRQMLRSVEAKGITGSGKSSGSGKWFTEAIVNHPRSTCFIIAQKPEDKLFYQELFKRRKKPLVVIEEGSKSRCNFLETERRARSDTRGQVEFLMTLGEALDGGQPRTSDPFWKKLEERILFGAIEALKQGTGKVDAADLLKFLSTAAYKPEKLRDEAWQAMFHNQTMAAAFAKNKTRIEQSDFNLIFDFWTNEFVNMDDKPRSSGLAGVLNTLHTFNTGLVREICSTDTNIYPAVMDQGISVLVNFPFSEYGPTGRFIAGGLKYLWQKHVLRRHWQPTGYFNVGIFDEYQEVATTTDAPYLAQCRSHGGCLFCLTQTVHSEYAAMGHTKHRADQLLSNFGTHIYHTVDAATAKFASELLGHRLEDIIHTTPEDGQGLGEEILGRPGVRCSVNPSYQPILQPAVFQSGLRCGGPPEYVVDGIVIKSGERFSNGENWLHVTFPQR